MGDTNHIYYTFSTIAQSLAGALGLLGAFVLFRLQSLSQETRGWADKLASMHHDPQIRDHADRGEYQQLLALAAKDDGPDHKRNREMLQKYLAQSHAIADRFKIASGLTVALVFSSVGALIAGQHLAAWPRTPRLALFAVAMLWLAGCMWSYFDVIRKSLTE